jgi:hypothetical protein
MRDSCISAALVGCNNCPKIDHFGSSRFVVLLSGMDNFTLNYHKLLCFLSQNFISWDADMYNKTHD